MGNIISLNVNGLLGEASVRWKEASRYSVGHYEAFVTVPYQESRWVQLFVYNKDALADAINKAKEVLENEIERCTIF